jgi:hypothetical protein
MKLRIYIGLLALTMTASAWGNSEGMDEKPYIFASQSAQITAIVEAIDHETREVTLRGPQGNSVTLIASEDARNLGQVSVGDLVNAEYTRSLSIEVVAGDGSEPGAGALTAAGRTPEGDMPGAAVMDTQVVTASVEEINIEANTFKLKFPDGSVQQFTARDPENLKRAEVGDMVVITATEALALMVEKATAE